MYRTRILYLSVLLIASVVVTAGAVVWRKETPAETISATQGGASTISDSSFYNALPVENADAVAQEYGELMQDVANSAPFSYTLPFSSAHISAVDTKRADPEITVPQTTSSATKIISGANNSSALDPYFFLPRGLINASAPVPTRNKEQRAIFDYGNNVGSHIQAFESAHKNIPKVLKDFFDDRASQAKAEGVLYIASEYEKLGNNIAGIAGIDSVPKEAAMLHVALAQGYIKVSAGLASITKTQGDKELVDAIIAYDASADEFIKNYVALTEFFGAYGVKFSAGDPGSVFTFSPGF